MAGDYVCVPRTMLESLQQAALTCQQPSSPVRTVSRRDMRVLYDPLYPPVGRANAGTHVLLQHAAQNRQLLVPTRPSSDSFRLVAYITNTQDQADVWKLFGSEVYAGGRHKFYMSSTNAAYKDIKLPIDIDSVHGNTLRDIYSLPSEVRFNVTKVPFVKGDTYRVTELPRADWIEQYWGYVT